MRYLHLTAVLVALGFSAAAFADEYDRIASGAVLPPNESAYGYSLSDPYTDGTIVAQESADSAAAGASAARRKLETAD